MPILKVEPNVQLKRKLHEPVGFQLYDCFEDYFPRSIEAHLRELNVTYPLASLKSQIDAGNVTEGQWLLYTTVCFIGQTNNGGLEGFLGNCPGLVLDVEMLLNDWGANGLAEAYRAAASELVSVIKTHASLNPVAQGKELDGFWSAFEATDESVGAVEAKSIEASAFSNGRENDPTNWFTGLETNVLKFVGENPSHFKHSET